MSQNMSQNMIEITRRTRNIGVGWTNQPSGRGTGIETPTEDERGGLATVRRVLADCYRINSGGTFYRRALFVGGRRVVGIANGWGTGDVVADVLNALEYDGRVSVVVE